MTTQSAPSSSRFTEAELDAALRWMAAERIRRQIVTLARARRMTPELRQQMQADAGRLEAESERLFREAGR